MRTFIDETRKFCAQKGFKIDKISFMYVYDGDLQKPDKSIRSESDTVLQIIKTEDEQFEAIILVGSFVEINKT